MPFCELFCTSLFHIYFEFVIYRMSETSEFNVVDSRIQGLGRAWEELGQMPLLLPPMTHVGIGGN